MKPRQEIYDLYWYFAYERQSIFFKKLRGEKPPWTKDPILQTYKFCNAYRASDRVSQYLIRNVIYTDKKYTDEDIVFRIILFKLFNKITTWELLEKHIGDISIETFDFRKYSKILSKAKKEGIKLYNDAYISCANKVFGYKQKHDNHLALIKKMIDDKVATKIIRVKNMEEAFKILKSYPLIGDFTAYQLVTDINYSEAVDFDECSFTVVGPGSLRGIKKCFVDIGDMSYEDIIKWMTEHQDQEFKRLGLLFQRLGNRPLQYIDCQNLFCELDKYCRVAKPYLISNRVRIKKKYRPNKNKIEYFYPPKWGVNKLLNEMVHMIK